MRNGYFQLICSSGGTALKIFAPQDGGKPVAAREVVEYLNGLGLAIDTTVVSRGLQDAVSSGKAEYLMLLSREKFREVNGNYALSITPDRMFASARFYPPSLGGQPLSYTEFLGDLSYKKISVGILKDQLQKFFEKPMYCVDVPVAKGQAPRHGKDAVIEYYFDIDPSAKPTLKEDGSVDFFNLNTISHCRKGDVLARLFPEDPGEYGLSIFDEKIKPRDVKHAVLKHGRNITLSEDRQRLIAEVDGHVSLVEDKVFVSDLLEVENVDNSTGNIDYEGSVKINGNVFANFSVKAKGNIEVSGVVEGAYLEAEGDIIIARGMNGMVKGTLKAGGNIIAKYIENAHVEAEGYVSAGSILHSEVMAGTEIIVSGKRGFITGGRVCAGNSIQVKTLGSSMGADTIVEVGADPTVKVRMQELQKLMLEDKKVLDSVHPILSAMTQKLSQGVKLRPDQVKYFQEMLQTEKEKKAEMEACLSEMDSLQALLDKSADAKVEVYGEVFAGTRISIAEASMVVKGGMHYCKFIKSQGDVKMAAL